MRAVQIRSYGPSDVLEYVDLGRPSPGPNQCLVKVHASGVNPLDWKIRQGTMRLFIRLRLPVVLGHDFCGEVAQAGRDVHRFKEGDWVYGTADIKHGGAYAEYAVADESAMALQPNELSPEETAALPIAGLTALQALRNKGKVHPGQRVLVIGASGGVGHFAVQIGKTLGAHLTAVCGTDNVEWVQGLGADRVIDYRKVDYEEESEMYDIILDAVAVDSFWACRKRLTPKGIYITTLPSIGLFFAILSLPLTSKKRARFLEVRHLGDDLGELNRLVAEGRLRPKIERVYPLSEARAAHEHSERGRTRGKLVLRVVDKGVV